MKIATIARILRELYRDPDSMGKRLEALQRIGHLLISGYRFTFPDADWWHNAAFNEYLAASGEANGFNTLNRMMLAELLRLTHVVPGDTAECGVFRGSTSMLILQANAASPLDKHHHMFDSFEGLSDPGDLDGNHWTKGNLSCGIDEVRSRLATFENKTLYQGWIPSRFAEVQQRRFSFVHLDVDLYQPTRDSIEFFYPRLEVGGILLCDDYGSGVCPGATKACDEFLSEHAEAMISLPAAGGFLVKGTHTAPPYGS
jgi:O-methyltransferase